MKEFGFYDTAGVIAPGMIFVVGAMALFLPDCGKEFLAIANVSIGSLGLGLILSYAAGHLLQAVGNGLEKLWWGLWSGMPIDWVRSGKHELIAAKQLTLLEARIRVMLNEPELTLSTISSNDWRSITRQIYAAVAGANRNSRVDTFNGIYGLGRGLAAALSLLLIGTLCVRCGEWQIAIVLLILLGLAIYRMHSFGVVYGRELLIQYLQAPVADNGKNFT